MCPQHVNGLVVQRGPLSFPREHVGVYLGHASSSWSDQPRFSKPTTETILFDEECTASVSCSFCKTKLPAPRVHLLLPRTPGGGNLVVLDGYNVVTYSRYPEGSSGLCVQ